MVKLIFQMEEQHSQMVMFITFVVMISTHCGILFFICVYHVAQYGSSSNEKIIGGGGG